MKRAVILVVMFMTVVAVNSCGNKGEDVRITATDFLNAYFKVEYVRAAELCTDELKADIVRTMESLESLEPEIKEMVIRNTAQTTTEIISIDTESKKDNATVIYKIVLPNFPEGIENTLSLVKVGKVWKISDFGQ